MTNGFTQDYDVTGAEVVAFTVPLDIARRDVRRIVFSDTAGAVNRCEIVVDEGTAPFTEIFRHLITAQANAENEHKGTKKDPVMSLRPGSRVSLDGDGVGTITFEWIDVQ